MFTHIQLYIKVILQMFKTYHPGTERPELVVKHYTVPAHRDKPYYSNAGSFQFGWSLSLCPTLVLNNLWMTIINYN